MVGGWRLAVIFTSGFRIGGAILCLLGAIGVVVEGSYLKYARAVHSNEGAYAWGLLGWSLVEYGAYAIVVDALASICYFAWQDDKALVEAWPFHSVGNYPFRNVIRDVALSVGFLLLGIGAGTNAWAYPDVAPYDGMDEWVGFYQTRRDNRWLHNGAYTLFIGSILLLVCIPTIAIYCERLDVFYILPVYRCRQERRTPHPTDEVVCCFHVGRPQPVACLLQTGATAVYQNNWFGAFFNHIYPAFFFYTLASVFWIASLNVGAYAPFSRGANDLCDVSIHTVYGKGLAYTCHHEYEDSGYYFFVGATLLVTASSLFTIHALVYYASILLNRPLIVDNFVDNGTHSTHPPGYPHPHSPVRPPGRSKFVRPR